MKALGRICRSALSNSWYSLLIRRSDFLASPWLYPLARVAPDENVSVGECF